MAFPTTTTHKHNWKVMSYKGRMTGLSKIRTTTRAFSNMFLFLFFNTVDTQDLILALAAKIHITKLKQNLLQAILLISIKMYSVK